MTKAKPASDIDRTRFIGGSDVPALLGIAPKFWARNTPLALYEDKIAPRVEQDRDYKPQMRRGHRWESVVAEMLVEALEALGHTVEVGLRNQRYTDALEPAFACEIDYELKLDGNDEIVNCELKTVHPFGAREWGEQLTDEAPIFYIAQCMWGLGITDRNLCILAALIGADYIKPYIIRRDNDLIEQIRSRAHTFWHRNVQGRIPPEPTSLADLARLFPSEAATAALEGDDDCKELWLRARAADRAIKAGETEFEQLEFQLKRKMAECAELVIDGKTAATWRNRDFSWLDQAALKEQEPKLHRQYMRKEPRRIFLLK